MVLVDTSVWVAHLRDGHAGLVALLEETLVLAHPFVIGELTCGNLRNRKDILALLRAIPAVDVAGHEEILGLIEQRGLMGRGLGYVDVHLLGSALLGGVVLWTLNRRLAQAAHALSVGFAEPRMPRPAPSKK